MVVDKTRERKEGFILDGEKIDDVGSQSSAHEIRRRRQLAIARREVQHRVTILWKSRGVNLGRKVRSRKGTAFPTVTHGCESLVMTS